MLFSLPLQILRLAPRAPLFQFLLLDAISATTGIGTPGACGIVLAWLEGVWLWLGASAYSEDGYEVLAHVGYLGGFLGAGGRVWGLKGGI